MLMGHSKTWLSHENVLALRSYCSAECKGNRPAPGNCCNTSSTCKLLPANEIQDCFADSSDGDWKSHQQLYTLSYRT